MTALSRKIVEKYVKRVFIQPCPKCGSWNIRAQTPIILDEELDFDNPKQVISVFAKAYKNHGGVLEGPCYFMCFDCEHKGPSVDCTGRTANDIGQDPIVYAEMKRLWNEQQLLRDQNRGSHPDPAVQGNTIA